MARMFSPSNESSLDLKDEPDPSVRCRGTLVQSLQKLHCQVHPTLNACADALEYVESLILRLLGTLCASRPHAYQDVEERVLRTFPKPLDHVAIRDALNALERCHNFSTLRRTRYQQQGGAGHGLTLPVEKLHPLIRELIGHKVEFSVSLYVCAVLEYVARDILKLTGNYVKNIRHTEVTLQDCRVAMCADPVLDELFCFTGEEWAEERVELTEVPEKNYANQVSDLMVEEREHIKNLQLIIKVFRHALASDQLSQSLSDDELEVVFGNIEDVLEFSAALLSSFEDVVEMTDEDQTPALGSCFYDMAENYEFDVFEDYAQRIASPDCASTLQEILDRPAVHEALQHSSQGFWLAARYVLPRLLWTPILHCLHYFEAIRVMSLLAVSAEDRESFEQTDGLVSNLKSRLTNLVSNSPLKKNQEGLFLRRRSTLRLTAAQKLADLSKCVDGWSELQQREIAQSCQEFVLEGSLLKLSTGNKRPTERHAFLFDGLILLCKPASAQSRSRGQAEKESYKLKEKFFIRKIEVVDKVDTDEQKFAFEIICRNDGSGAATPQSTVLIARTMDDKINWLASLVAVSMRSYLERSLDSILSAEEKQHPLRLPDNYKFSESDTTTNIMFEEKSTGGVPLIKGATLYKLVERLTFHMYADPSFVRTFLTTFRSFCSPRELLQLLMERYNIPDLEENNDHAAGTIEQQQMAKRFRKEYKQPVQVRVLNVIRHWVEHHYYDFERDQQLLDELREFLEGMRQDLRSGKNMRKWIDSITKAIQRKQEQQGTTKEHTFSHDPPPIEWYLARDAEKFDLLTLHPVELARQLTLLEFDHYRAVQPSELVNAAWTKKDKHKTSPNLLKIIHHSSNFSFYLEKLIVECQNFEERVAVVSRCIEIMVVLQELNNFTGVFAISSALQSAPVHRLEHTHTAVRSVLRRALDDVLDLQSVHGRKYQERLRSINPPCVPFLGMYLTNILHIEEGNPDMIAADGAELINFSKRRKVAEITGEIQQYQNQPYNLTVEREIRAFLEQLGPQIYQSEKELHDYLYQCSLQIEPRGARQPIKAPRRWPDLPLKSPGTKTTRNHSTRSSGFTSMSSATSSITLSNQQTSATSTTTSPNPPHSPEETPLLPSTPTSPPSSGDTHVPVLVPMIDPPTIHHHHPHPHHHQQPVHQYHAGHQNQPFNFIPSHQNPPPLHQRANSHPNPSTGVFFPASPSSPHKSSGRFAFPPPPPLETVAPPLPPRTRKDDSTSPALPPRGAGGESPPPLPPRKPHIHLPSTQPTQPSGVPSPTSTADVKASTPTLPPKTHRKPRPPPLVLHQSNADPKP